MRPGKLLEHLHLARACFWIVLLPVVLILGWQSSVLLVICLSLYANFGTDISAWQAARAERRSMENPPAEKPA